MKREGEILIKKERQTHKEREMEREREEMNMRSKVMMNIVDTNVVEKCISVRNKNLSEGRVWIYCIH